MISRRTLHSLAMPTIVMAGALMLSMPALAQTSTPSAPAPAASTPSAPAPATQAQLPPVNPKNFTAAQPTRAEVESFLKTSWGYDTNRTYEVYGILKTPAPGVSKVIVFVAEKGRPQVAGLTFFVTPDGHYLIANDSIIPFGPHPFAAARATLQQDANGAWQGSASKQHELVEFADFQCPHCKAAQPTAKKLIADFPNARYVYQPFPLVNVHPEAFKAADYGNCVTKLGGNTAFFKFADSVFANQDDLVNDGGTPTLDAAVKAAGLDPAKVAACAASPAGKAAVQADLKLANELNVNETPTLFVDGRPVPMTELPYSELKKIIEYQFNLDSNTASK
jgi:protein-disulfide isomerase